MSEEKRYLLFELRLQNEKEYDEKKNLDSKSSNIASYSVTFTVLLFGFGSFLLDKIETDNNLLFASITTILIASLIISIVSIIFSVCAFRLRDYWYAIANDSFFRNPSQLSKDSEEWDEYIDIEEIDKWKTEFQKRESYEDYMIDQLVVGVRINSLNNDNKAAWINRAQLVFVFAVCMIPLILLVILAGVLAGTLSIG
jgi:hypothetical protein